MPDSGANSDLVLAHNPRNRVGLRRVLFHRVIVLGAWVENIALEWLLRTISVNSWLGNLRAHALEAWLHLTALCKVMDKKQKSTNQRPGVCGYGETTSLYLPGWTGLLISLGHRSLLFKKSCSKRSCAQWTHFAGRRLALKHPCQQQRQIDICPMPQTIHGHIIHVR